MIRQLGAKVQHLTTRYRQFCYGLWAYFVDDSEFTSKFPPLVVLKFGGRYAWSPTQVIARRSLVLEALQNQEYRHLLGVVGHWSAESHDSTTEYKPLTSIVS
jgi:hypothetical protein